MFVESSGRVFDHLHVHSEGGRNYNTLLACCKHFIQEDNNITLLPLGSKSRCVEAHFAGAVLFSMGVDKNTHTHGK